MSASSAPANRSRVALKPASRRMLLLHSCLIGLVVSCRQILDIEEANLDPGVASTAGASGSDGSGGSESSAGASESSGGSAAGMAESGGNGPEAAGTGNVTNNDGGTGNVTNNEGGSAGSDDGPPPPSLCQTYCATLTDNCGSEYAQYSDLATCLAVCHALPEGTLGDDNVNTVHCRLAQAKKAAGGEPFFYCPLAGPGGGGECGEDCDGYCSLMMSLCTAENTGGLYYFANIGLCKQACKDLPVDGAPYNPSLHSAGPHFQCRLFHACSAVADPDYHCGHALGEPPCQIPVTP